MVPIFLRLRRPPGAIIQKLGRVDWVGSILFVASTTSFLIPITWGGVQYSWSSWNTLVPLFVGIAGVVGWVVYEIYIPSEPITPIRLFKSYNMAYSLFAATIHTLTVYACLYFLPLYYEAVKGLSPILSGVALFTEKFTVAPLSPASWSQRRRITVPLFGSAGSRQSWGSALCIYSMWILQQSRGFLSTSAPVSALDFSTHH